MKMKYPIHIHKNPIISSYPTFPAGSGPPYYHSDAMAPPTAPRAPPMGEIPPNWNPQVASMMTLPPAKYVLPNNHPNSNSHSVAVAVAVAVADAVVVRGCEAPPACLHEGFGGLLAVLQTSCYQIAEIIRWLNTPGVNC